MVDKPPIQRIEDALAQYYKQFGRNDYFDVETGMGKFRQFVATHKLFFIIDSILGDDVFLDDWIFVDMDPMFPLLVSSDASREDTICQILKHCHKYGVVPIT
eukprot:893293_1